MLYRTSCVTSQNKLFETGPCHKLQAIERYMNVHIPVNDRIRVCTLGVTRSLRSQAVERYMNVRIPVKDRIHVHTLDVTGRLHNQVH